MSSTRFLKFYPSDWRGDPGLRICSIAARGLWIDMITLMHDAEPYGTLTINGKAIEPAALATLLNLPEAQVVTLIEELRRNGVFSTQKNGVIFSRKMKRDRKMREKGKENAMKRWGATPKQTTEKPQQKDHPNGDPITPARAPSRPRYQIPDKEFSDAGASSNPSLFSGELPSNREHGHGRVNGKAFASFWQLYPHKVGKANAQKAFAKAVKAAPVENIMAGLKRYARKTDDRPWCNPATFLNQQRWEDQPAVTPPRGQGPPPGRWSVGDVAMRRLREMEENDDDDDSDINKGFRQGDAQADAEKPRHVASTAVKIDRRD